ncbi:hypothetical protein LJC64_02440 [Ruminococcaceae bacterium OttesenSCG-928-A11]|nr:hypothetical protein [Ruminococcaceae bacterium OttesenSCG-928-A11]
MTQKPQRKTSQGKNSVNTYWELLIGSLVVGFGAVLARVIVFLVTIK